MFALSKSEVRQILSVIDLDSPFGRRDYLLQAAGATASVSCSSSTPACGSVNVRA